MKNRDKPSHPGSAGKSLWADAIGDLYTMEAVVDLLGVDEASVLALVENKELLMMLSSEGDRLFSVQQFDEEGQILCGVDSVARSLVEVLDSYMLFSWLNKPHRHLAAVTPWEHLRENGRFTNDLHAMTLLLRMRMKQ